ncbi:MAG: DUF6273 domain-containing protein [Bacteroidales bacterium]|nr:DUF6273 domain-containing protein [Bacteroidales bacterium]
MKLYRCKYSLMAVLSLSILCLGCSSMLNSLSQSISELNDQLAANLSNPPAPTPAPTPTPAQALSSRPQAFRSAVFKGTPYTVLPAGTDGSIGPKGSYVLFGDWPQSLKPVSVTVNEAIAAKVGGHTYYQGSDACWYIKIKTKYVSGYYSDGTRVKSNEVRYFKVEPIKWRVLTSNYNGSGKKLLLAESVLMNMAFNDQEMDQTELQLVDGTQMYFKLEKRFRQLENGSYIHHNNYEHSRIRAYLNGVPYIQADDDGGQRINEEFVSCGFLQTAFTPELQTRIATTTVDNSLNAAGPVKAYTGFHAKVYTGRLYYEYGENKKRVYFPGFICNNTQDKVFLLSEKEAIRSDYGFRKIDPKVNENNFMEYLKAGVDYKWEDLVTSYVGLPHPMTDFSIGNGVGHSAGRTTAFWFLRTPICFGYSQKGGIFYGEQETAAVSDLGDISRLGLKSTSNGVVPAICVK